MALLAISCVLSNGNFRHNKHNPLGLLFYFVRFSIFKKILFIYNLPVPEKIEGGAFN